MRKEAGDFLQSIQRRAGLFGKSLELAVRQVSVLVLDAMKMLNDHRRLYFFGSSKSAARTLVCCLTLSLQLFPLVGGRNG